MTYNDIYTGTQDERICTCEGSHQLYAEGDCCPACNGIVYASAEVEDEKLLLRARFEELPKVLVRFNSLEVPSPKVPAYLYH